jgi:dipeptidase D
MNTQADLPTIDSLAPAAVWRYFAEIAATPRPSKCEERIRAYVRAEAGDNGFTCREDSVGNLVIEVPASPGCEASPIVVLQGHLDMVCDKNAETAFDFSRDPIRMVVDRDAASGEPIVRADGTTLGADNGIGLALALAAATSPDITHGPLELLCTVDEEMGMTGAGALEPDAFRGRCLLNLDSEEDDALYIGCAGGGDTTASWDFGLQPVSNDAQACRVTVSGLRGGHSGGDIHENRGNAIKVLTQTLRKVKGEDLRLGEINGGNKRNVIPREAQALVFGPPGTLSALQDAAATVRRAVAEMSQEPNLVISTEQVTEQAPSAALSAGDTQLLLGALADVPHGVIEMHPKIENLVQTSNNLATVASVCSGRNGTLHVEIGTLSRSSVDARMEETRDEIIAVAERAGGAATKGDSYPGWEPNMDSALLATCRGVYERLFGQPPKVLAIHAGLECGIIGQRVSGMDMISFGPRIEGAHSPDERVYVASVQKAWDYLAGVLAELATSG